MNINPPLLLCCSSCPTSHFDTSRLSHFHRELLSDLNKDLFWQFVGQFAQDSKARSDKQAYNQALHIMSNLLPASSYDAVKV